MKIDEFPSETQRVGRVLRDAQGLQHVSQELFGDPLRQGHPFGLHEVSEDLHEGQVGPRS